MNDEQRMREHLDSCVWVDPGRQSGQPCFGGTRVPVLPFMKIVDEAGVEAAKAFWPSVTDAHVEAGRALLTFLQPQPVDRAAISKVFDEHQIYIDHWDEFVCTCAWVPDDMAHRYHEHRMHLRDAIAALLTDSATEPDAPYVAPDWSPEQRVEAARILAERNAGELQA